MKSRIPIARPSFLGNEKKYVTEAMDTGWISSIGPFIDRFEQEFALFHGMKHGIATHNGTIALHLALAAAGITEGDEVIVPDLTFIATANSVRYCNAVPVLADVASSHWNITAEEIVKTLSAATKALIPVHLYGNPASMKEIMEIAAEKRLVVIEDCAEATGAMTAGKRIGSFGHISCFSFFGNKIMTTGEGGMCMTNDDDLAEVMRILRDHGMNRKRKYWYDRLGFNYRMTNLQAAVGLAQLEQLENLISARDHILDRYREKLKGCHDIIFQDTSGNRSVNWLVTVRLRNFTFEKRDQVMKELDLLNIDTRPVFYPISMMPFYRDSRFRCHELPVSRQISQEGISLPTFIGLHDDQIDYIAASLVRCVEKLRP